MRHLLQARYVGALPGLTDQNSGSARHVATVFPACPRDWRWVGQRGYPGYDRHLPPRELVFRPHPDAGGAVLCPVAEWSYVWGTAQGWGIWRAVPPPGYVALGDVFHFNYPPDRELTFATFACVRADCALPARVGYELWNDRGIGVRRGAALWAVPDGTDNPWQRFRAHPGYDRPTGPFHTLDPNVVEILPDP